MLDIIRFRRKRVLITFSISLLVGLVCVLLYNLYQPSQQFASDFNHGKIDKSQWEILSGEWDVENGWLKGHAGKPYYEATDGVGILMEALLDLAETVPPGPAKDGG